MYLDIFDTVDVCQEGIDLKVFVVKTGQRIVSEHSIRTVKGIDLIKEA